MNFPTNSSEIAARISAINPIKYSQSRNFIDGKISYLSPYISRGYISTKQMMSHVLDLGLEPHQTEKFIQELAWRDYWQHIWVAKKKDINYDVKQSQPRGKFIGLPEILLEAKTNIKAIDNGIEQLYETGYLHNHLRMYLASITCNIGRYKWQTPAKWMYYHLLDADWASNALSWQWVSGANSSKLYFANQENINKYCHTNQKGTFMDVDYESIENIALPESLKKSVLFDLKTQLPASESLIIESSNPTLIYNFYNLDPLWHNDKPANRILLLEPSVFQEYPVSQKSIEFCTQLGKENIENLQIFVGEFSELKKHISDEIRFKEHPLNNYSGIEESREWMFDITGEFNSFFSFWKKCKKQLEKM
jgi:deoxyribodipyrimidine photo-lyase